MRNMKQLVLKQLQEKLSVFHPLLNTRSPKKGWIRAIRGGLGMSGRQLANRLNVTRQRISEIEKQEILGTVTLNTINKVSDALECEFVYSIIPKTNFQEIVWKQAEAKAKKQLNWASHTMELENQALSTEENSEILSNMINEIVQEMPSNLWDD